jgi:uroporphyrinogen-III synthase
MNVLITRPIDQSISIINKLSKNSFYPFILPLIEIAPIEFHIEEYDFNYIIFTSQNACKFFINNFKKIDLIKTQIIAIGPKTADFLKNIKIPVHLIPDEYSTEGLKKLFLEQNIKNKKILIPGSDLRDKNFENFCHKSNNYILSPTIYSTKPIIYSLQYVDNFIKEYAIEVVTLFSPSAAKALLDQFDYNKNHTIKYICIGGKTANCLKQKGLDPLFPVEFTEDGIINILTKLKNGGIK